MTVYERLMALGDNMEHVYSEGDVCEVVKLADEARALAEEVRAVTGYLRDPIYRGAGPSALEERAALLNRLAPDTGHE